MKIKEYIAANKNKIIYWFFTLWLALGMLSTGIVQLIEMEEEIDFIIELGYPIYFLTIGCLENSGCSIRTYSRVSFAEGMGLCRLFLCHVGSGIIAFGNGRSCK